MAETNGQRQTDWFLWAIIAGVIVLVGITLFLVFRGSPPPAFQPDDTPEGVAFNYFLAIQQKDYDRAYGYLSPEIVNGPEDAGAFFADIQTTWDCASENFSSRSFEVTKTEVFSDRAVITLSETVYTGSRDLFSSGRYSQSVIVRLERAGGSWQITSSDRCWFHDWNVKPKT